MKRMVLSLARYLFVLLAAALMIGGCDLPMGPGGSAGGGEGNLTISLGGDSRAISSGKDLPADVLAALRYEMVLTGPGGETLEHTITGGESLRLTVGLGQWRIDAKAYQETVLAGTGSVSFMVVSGSNSIQIPMKMSGPCYTITIPAISHGTVRSNFSAAFAGTPITLTVTPDAGYVLKDGGFKYSYADELETTSSGSSCTFDMPSSDIAVTVTAEFVDKGIRYVKEGGTGNGMSWETASGDLQAMMNELAELKQDGHTGPFVVKVAAGKYTPQYKPTNAAATANGTAQIAASPGDRDSTFVLRSGVEIWGGYPASGGDSRNIATNKTILSGDLDNNDSTDGTIIGDNAYHVVLGAGIPADSGTVLDGLTISGGNANGGNNEWISVFDNRTLEKNSGGGIYNGLAEHSSSPVLINVTISGNNANGSGGGAHSYDSAPVFVNVLISGNTAGKGGGMANVSYSSPKLINVTIAGNYADSGGGIFSENSGYSIQNSVIWGNSSGTKNLGIYASLGTVTIANSIVQGSGGSDSWNADALVGSSGVATDDGGNLDGDPLFTTLVQAASGSPKTGGDYRLSNGSPAIDTGDDDYYTPGLSPDLSGITTDLAGHTRKNGTIDMGAYEF